MIRLSDEPDERILQEYENYLHEVPVDIEPMSYEAFEWMMILDMWGVTPKPKPQEDCI